MARVTSSAAYLLRHDNPRTRNSDLRVVSGRVAVVCLGNALSVANVANKIDDPPYWISE